MSDNVMKQAIESINTAVIESTTDVLNSMCDVDEKNYLIRESFEGDADQLKESFGLETIQEFTLIELLSVIGIVHSVRHIAKMIYNATTVNRVEKNLAQYIQNVAEIVQDSEGKNDPQKALDKFKKLKRALNKVGKLCDQASGYFSEGRQFMHEKYYVREIEEFAKLRQLASEIIDEKKLHKKRAKDGNTEVLQVELNGFFDQAKKVLEIIKKANEKFEKSHGSDVTTDHESEEKGEEKE